MASATLTKITTSDQPRSAPADYLTRAACAVERDDFFPSYVGSGIALTEHPLYRSERVNIQYAPESQRCGHCRSDNTLCIYFDYSESNADKFGVYELACQACGKFTAYTYAD